MSYAVSSEMQIMAFVNHTFNLRTTTFNRSALCPQSFSSGIAPLSRPARLSQKPQPSVMPIVMFSEDDEEDEAETVELVDPDSGRRLTVGIEYQFEFDDVEYLMCFPVDDPVVVAYEENDEMHEVGDADGLQEMFPFAKRALSSENILLKDTAYWWTVDDLGEFEEGDDENEEDMDEEGEVLVEFDFKGKQYSVVQPVFAVYMIAKEGESGFEALDGEELERISPIAEQVWMENTTDD